MHSEDITIDDHTGQIGKYVFWTNQVHRMQSVIGHSNSIIIRTCDLSKLELYRSLFQYTSILVTGS